MEDVKDAATEYVKLRSNWNENIWGDKKGMTPEEQEKFPSSIPVNLELAFVAGAEWRRLQIVNAPIWEVRIQNEELRSRISVLDKIAENYRLKLLEIGAVNPAPYGIYRDAYDNGFGKGVEVCRAIARAALYPERDEVSEGDAGDSQSEREVPLTDPEPFDLREAQRDRASEENIRRRERG